MAYSKEKFKSSGDKAFPSFRPLGIEKINKCVYGFYFSFKHILFSLTSFMGTRNSMRIMYNTSLLTEP
jgi:hypothetical protein